MLQTQYALKLLQKVDQNAVCASFSGIISRKCVIVGEPAQSDWADLAKLRVWHLPFDPADDRIGVPAAVWAGSGRTRSATSEQDLPLCLGVTTAANHLEGVPTMKRELRLPPDAVARQKMLLDLSGSRSPPATERDASVSSPQSPGQGSPRPIVAPRQGERGLQ